MMEFFDKLEDKVRGFLSHYPIAYGFVGGVGVVLFWRGVWHTTDWMSARILQWQLDSCGTNTVDCAVFPDGPLSLLIGTVFLLMTGLFVSNFIGNEIIISGLRGEKKLTERTEAEVKTETGALADIKKELRQMNKRLEQLEKRP
jgi:hypothetical protein